MERTKIKLPTTMRGGEAEKSLERIFGPDARISLKEGYAEILYNIKPSDYAGKHSDYT